MHKLPTWIALTLLAALATESQAVFEVTEVYPGVFGSDGTADWFEITNLGVTTSSTGGLYYNNENDSATAFPLPDLRLAAGESAVFLVEQTAELSSAYPNSIEEFYGVWGSGYQVGALNSAPRLANGGDEVWLFEGNSLSADLVDVKPVNGAFANSLRTIEFTADPLGVESTVGINGAYRSATFSSGSEIRRITGSPGESLLDPVAARLDITEAYGGVFGSDGSSDWFEVTNTGGRTASTDGVYYATDAGEITPKPLPVIEIAPGESVVFLIEKDAEREDLYEDSIDEFQALWGTAQRIEALDDADWITSNHSLWLLDGPDPTGRPIDEVMMAGDLSNDFRQDVYYTAQFTPAGEATVAVASVDGTRLSEEFDNSACFGDCPSPNPTKTLLGSPGVDVFDPILAGDYNDDGRVDAADYTVWRDSAAFGDSLAADGDNSGSIDGRDAAIWRQNYGNTATDTRLASTTAPEPSSALIATGMMVLVALRRRS